MGLQHDAEDNLIAFHWGDNKTGRNFAAINLKTNEGVVCLTNSANGPMIFREIAEPVVGDLSATSQWLSRRENLPMDNRLNVAQSNDYQNFHEFKDFFQQQIKEEKQTAHESGLGQESTQTYTS